MDNHRTTCALTVGPADKTPLLERYSSKEPGGEGQNGQPPYYLRIGCRPCRQNAPFGALQQ